MKLKFTIMIMLIMAMLMITSIAFAMTDTQMEDIMKTSKNWSDFDKDLQDYITDEGIAAWDFHAQVTAFLQDDVGYQDATTAETWWSTNGWYTENNVDWVWPWSLWYLKYTEKYNGAQWA